MSTIHVAEHEHTRLSERQLSTLRARLVRDLEQTGDLVAQLGVDLLELQTSRQDVATDDEHDPEGPTLAFERSQFTAVLNDARAHLEAIDSALSRIDGEEFGICESCRMPIPFARLEARPFALHCVGCAERAGR